MAPGPAAVTEPAAASSTSSEGDRVRVVASGFLHLLGKLPLHSTQCPWVWMGPMEVGWARDHSPASERASPHRPASGSLVGLGASWMQDACCMGTRHACAFAYGVRTHACLVHMQYGRWPCMQYGRQADGRLHIPYTCRSSACTNCRCGPLTWHATRMQNTAGSTACMCTDPAPNACCAHIFAWAAWAALCSWCTLHPPSLPSGAWLLLPLLLLVLLRVPPRATHAASQVSTRLVTFVINLLVARHLTPEAYGVRPPPEILKPPKP